MATNPFKAFVVKQMTVMSHDGNPVKQSSAYNALGALDNDDMPAQFVADDPSGGQWRTIGFADAHEGNLVHDLDGSGLLLNVQFNERILPGKVRDEHLAKRIADLTDQLGRKPSKKDYAQLRDQVEFELLPKSHIKRTNVYLMLMPDNRLFVFTSSPRKADDAVALFTALVSEFVTVSIGAYEVKDSVVAWLTGLAKDSDLSVFEPTDAGVLKKGKETIRVKDTDIGSNDVQTLLKSDAFDVTELAIDLYQSDTVRLSFVLTEKLVFKRCIIPDVVLSSSTDKGEDGKVAFHSFAYLVSHEYRTLLSEITSEMGGQVLQEPTTESAKKPAATDEDDEL